MDAKHVTTKTGHSFVVSSFGKVPKPTFKLMPEKPGAVIEYRINIEQYVEPIIYRSSESMDFSLDDHIKNRVEQRHQATPEDDLISKAIKSYAILPTTGASTGEISAPDEEMEEAKEPHPALSDPAKDKALIAKIVNDVLEARRLVAWTIKETCGVARMVLLTIDPSDPHAMMSKITISYGVSNHAAKAALIQALTSHKLKHLGGLRNLISTFEKELIHLERMECILPDDFNVSLVCNAVKSVPECSAIVNALMCRQEVTLTVTELFMQLLQAVPTPGAVKASEREPTTIEVVEAGTQAALKAFIASGEDGEKGGKRRRNFISSKKQSSKRFIKKKKESKNSRKTKRKLLCFHCGQEGFHRSAQCLSPCRNKCERGSHPGESCEEPPTFANIASSMAFVADKLPQEELSVCHSDARVRNLPTEVSSSYEVPGYTYDASMGISILDGAANTTIAGFLASLSLMTTLRRAMVIKGIGGKQILAKRKGQLSIVGRGREGQFTCLKTSAIQSDAMGPINLVSSARLRYQGFAILEVDNFVYILSRAAFGETTERGVGGFFRVRPLLVGIACRGDLFILNRWTRLAGDTPQIRSIETRGRILPPAPSDQPRFGLLGGMPPRRRTSRPSDEIATSLMDMDNKSDFVLAGHLGNIEGVSRHPNPLFNLMTDMGQQLQHWLQKLRDPSLSVSDRLRWKLRARGFKFAMRLLTKHWTDIFTFSESGEPTRAQIKAEGSRRRQFSEGSPTFMSARQLKRQRVTPHTSSSSSSSSAGPATRSSPEPTFPQRSREDLLKEIAWLKGEGDPPIRQVAYPSQGPLTDELRSEAADLLRSSGTPPPPKGTRRTRRPAFHQPPPPILDDESTETETEEDSEESDDRKLQTTMHVRRKAPRKPLARGGSSSSSSSPLAPRNPHIYSPPCGGSSSSSSLPLAPRNPHIISPPCPDPPTHPSLAAVIVKYNKSKKRFFYSDPSRMYSSPSLNDRMISTPNLNNRMYSSPSLNVRMHSSPNSINKQSKASGRVDQK